MRKKILFIKKINFKKIQKWTILFCFFYIFGNDYNKNKINEQDKFLSLDL